MIREHKYKPHALLTFCPVCGRHIDSEEWDDYGMHLRCTEFYNTQQFQESKKVLIQNEEKENQLNY